MISVIRIYFLRRTKANDNCFSLCSTRLKHASRCRKAKSSIHPVWYAMAPNISLSLYTERSMLLCAHCVSSNSVPWGREKLAAGFCLSRRFGPTFPSPISESDPFVLFPPFPFIMMFFVHSQTSLCSGPVPQSLAVRPSFAPHCPAPVMQCSTIFPLRAQGEQYIRQDSLCSVSTFHVSPPHFHLLHFLSPFLHLQHDLG